VKRRVCDKDDNTKGAGAPRKFEGCVQGFKAVLFLVTSPERLDGGDPTDEPLRIVREAVDSVDRVGERDKAKAVVDRAACHLVREVVDVFLHVINLPLHAPRLIEHEDEIDGHSLLLRSACQLEWNRDARFARLQLDEGEDRIPRCVVLRTDLDEDGDLRERRDVHSAELDNNSGRIPCGPRGVLCRRRSKARRQFGERPGHEEDTEEES